jgi:hypothetical protein
MSRMTTEREELERLEFARKAAAHFAEHPEHCSYTLGDIVPGVFLALRWGLDKDCVLVLKLDEYERPVNFQNIIKRK